MNPGRMIRPALVPSFRSSSNAAATSETNFEKKKGTSNYMILVPLIDLKSLTRGCSRRCRDFKSAALARRGLLQLVAELRERGSAVDAFRGRLADPVLDERLGAFAHLFRQFGRCVDDRHAGGTQRLESFAVGLVPGFSRDARDALACDRIDRVLVALGDCSPLRLIHEEPER